MFLLYSGTTSYKGVSNREQAWHEVFPPLPSPRKGNRRTMNTVLEQHPSLVAEAAPEARAEFIRRTYTHLAMAILAFIGLEVIFFQSGLAYALTSAVLGAGRIGWLVVLFGFMAVSLVAVSV